MLWLLLSRTLAAEPLSLAIGGGFAEAVTLNMSEL